MEEKIELKLEEPPANEKIEEPESGTNLEPMPEKPVKSRKVAGG